MVCFYRFGQKCTQNFRWNIFETFTLRESESLLESMLGEYQSLYNHNYFLGVGDNEFEEQSPTESLWYFSGF